MKLKDINFLPFLGAAVSIAGLLHYALYESWIGVINLGLGLFVTILSKRRTPMKEKHSIGIKILDYIILIILIMNTILAFYKLFAVGNIKQFVFLLEMSIIIFIEIFVLERRKQKS